MPQNIINTRPETARQPARAGDITVLCREKIESRFIRSLLYYIPYAVLSAMTIPAIFYSTGYLLSAAFGLAVAVILSLLEKKLLTVAIGACSTVFIVECVMKYLI